MKVKVLGPGCPRCKATYENVKRVVEREGIDAEIEYVTDMDEVIKLGVLATPAVWVDGEVVLQGKIPSEGELLKHLKRS